MSHSQALALADVLLVEDHALLSLGLQAQLAVQGIEASIADLRSVEALLDQVVAALPVLVVLDLGLPFVGGGAALVGPIVGLGAEVVVLTGETDLELKARCFEAGALGVVSKDEDLPTILKSIERARNGDIVDVHQRDTVLAAERVRRAAEQDRLAAFESLSVRESVVLLAIIDGMNAAQIATRDFVSVGTVRTQIKAVLRKLGVSSQLEAVAVARNAGWSGTKTAERAEA